MGKKRKSAPEPAAEVFSHNPFAALDRGPAAPAPEPTKPTGESPNEPAATPTEVFENSWKTKVVVRRETKGRGGKTVTRVTGVPKAQLPAVALRMKKALGCGAVVEGPEFVLLGSLVDRAADWLEADGAGRVVRGN